MKISIITAVFNNEKTVARALQSIDQQVYKNIEHIIVDGKSDDKSCDIIKKFINHNNIFISESDNGIYDALNKGLSFATGDIVAFLHADDLYADKFSLSRVVEIFQDKKVDIVYGDASYFDGDETSKVVRKYKSNKLTKKNLAWGKMPVHPSIFIKKSIYEQFGSFRTEFKIAGDYDFLCRIINYDDLSSYYEPRVFVLMQRGGVSTTRTLKNTIILNKEILNAIKDNNIYTNIFMVLSRYFFKIQQFIRK